MTEVIEELLTALPLADLCRVCQVERTAIVALVEFGILEPAGRQEEDWAFDHISIQRARRAVRLQRDLGVNTAGIALILDLLDERAILLRERRWEHGSTG